MQVRPIREKSRVALGSQDESENFLRIVNRLITMPLTLPRVQPLSNSMVCNHGIHWKSLDVLGEGISTSGYRSKTRNFLVLISKSDATGYYCLKWSMLGVSFGMAFNIPDMH